MVLPNVWAYTFRKKGKNFTVLSRYDSYTFERMHSILVSYMTSLDGRWTQ